jgi:translation initiation factor 1
MSKKKKNSFKNREGIVYSTNPDFNYFEGLKDMLDTPDSEEQNLLVRIERKGRGGKVVTIVEGFVGSESDLKDLAKMLKNKCGVGGSQKDGEIIIQGDVKDKVFNILSENNYKVKKSG